jgi:uncharacterized protein YecT (DUF1311 family)
VHLVKKRDICLIWGAAAFLAVAGQMPSASAAETDLAKICKQEVNDDTVRDYQPSLHDAALKAFKEFFPDAAEKPADDMLATQAKFRCMGGRIYTCFIGANLPCSKMNTDEKNPGAEAFCKDNPAADSVPMVATGHDTLYSYRCKDGHAEVAGKLYQTDQRGFAESLWKPIDAETQAPAPAAASGDPIEAQLEKCLARPDGQSTRGMTRCTHKAYNAYEEKMHAVFRKVMHKLDDRSAKLVRDAQERWEAYRKAQDKANEGPWRGKRGSMTGPDIGQMRVDAIRARIKELSYYLQK